MHLHCSSQGNVPKNSALILKNETKRLKQITKANTLELHVLVLDGIYLSTYVDLKLVLFGQQNGAFHETRLLVKD